MLAALIVIGVISLVTVATLQLANISKQQAAIDARSLSQVACVDAARQYLLSRLRLFGAPATSIVLNQAIQIGTGTIGLSGNAPVKQIRTGHVNGPAITSVTAVRAGFLSTTKAVERSNVLGSPGIGGVGYTAVVTCTDPQAKDMELEFTFQFGK